MPRGVKESKKAVINKAGSLIDKSVAAKKTKNAEPALTTSPKKPRKPYPSREDRIALAEAKITRLVKTNDSRRSLIDKAEEAQIARKVALTKSIAQLEMAIGKRDRLIALKEKPVKASAPKRSAEELRAIRAENLKKARAARKKTVKEPKPKLSAEEIRAKRVENAAKARAARKKTAKAPKTKMTPEELKAFRVENLAKAQAARKQKRENQS